MKQVACIGECMVELSEHQDGTLTRAFGGDTLNTSIYLARLGVPPEYVTALGTDPFSEEMLDAWTTEGIGTALIPRLPDHLPGLYLIRVDAEGERRFYYWRDSAPVKKLFRLPQTAAIEAALCRMDLLYLSGVTLSLFDDPGRDRLFATLERVRRGGGQVAFDTNFRPRGWPDPAAAQTVYARALRTSDIVLASVEDHALLHRSADPAALFEHLRAAGVPEIVVKHATPSCDVMVGGRACHVEAPPVADVVDTTAAGDSFAAAYLAARLAGADPIAAAHAGHALAGTVVRYRGAIIPLASMPRITLT